MQSRSRHLGQRKFHKICQGSLLLSVIWIIFKWNRFGAFDWFDLKWRGRGRRYPKIFQVQSSLVICLVFPRRFPVQPYNVSFIHGFHRVNFFGPPSKTVMEFLYSTRQRQCSTPVSDQFAVRGCARRGIFFRFRFCFLFTLTPESLFFWSSSKRLKSFTTNAPPPPHAPIKTTQSSSWRPGDICNQYFDQTSLPGEHREVYCLLEDTTI